MTRNIGEAFAEAAGASPDKDAIIAEDFAITYGNLARVVARFALRFQNEGVGRGSVVGIDTDDAIVMIASMFALSRLGAAFTTVGPEFREEDPIGLTHAFRTEDRPGPGTRAARLFDDAYSPKVPFFSLEPLRTPGFRLMGDPAWILCSSGTTGKPKAVAISAATLWRRVEAAAEDFGDSIAALGLLFRPYARPYPIRAAAALLHGTPVIDSQSPDFLRRHGVDVVCASKQQAHEWMRMHAPLSPPLPRIQVSGARLYDEDIAGLLQGFDVVENVYGSNESIAAEITQHRRTAEGVIAERRNLGTEVEVVDDTGALCPPGIEGQVRIRNGFLAPGYLGNPTETAKRFRDGWFYPGDVALRDEDGILHILGRQDDVANLGGVKLNMLDIDQALSMGRPGQACCFVVPDETRAGQEQLAAMIVAAPQVAPRDLAASAWTACVKRHGLKAAPGRILLTQSLPVAADGTPKRKAVRDLFIARLTARDPTDLGANLFEFKAAEDE